MYIKVISLSIIIPMNYDEKSLKSFLKEGGLAAQAGGEGVSPIEKLTIKKKDLEGKEGEIQRDNHSHRFQYGGRGNRLIPVKGA